MDTTEEGTVRLEGGTLPLPFADALAPPTRLGPYDEVRPFACGGMGMVCRARQRMPDREVAIKVLRAGTRASAAQKERFLREIRLAANLDHPGIVPVFDAGEQDGWLYFVMPFLEDAESLIDHAVSQRLDWRARVGLAVRAADIVEVLHHGGMLHRDLKPGNILVDRHGEVRLLDFGLATALEPQIDGPRLSCGGIAGTPAYLSPEQAAGVPARELTPAADVYALGVVTYELLTGHMPYEVECPLPEILRSIREARPAAPSSFVLDLPPAVEQVILRALSKDPARRPADAGAYAAALRRALDAATGKHPSGSSWLPRGRLARAALAVGLVLLLAAGATTVHRGLGLRGASPVARSAPSLQPPVEAASAAPGTQLAAEVAPHETLDAPGSTSTADGGAMTRGGEKGTQQQGAGIAVAAARIVFVRPNAAGAGNGTSWADAYTDLQPALAAAANGGEIWVAAGTYKPSTGGDRTRSFQMEYGIGLYGGFVGTETLRTQRDWGTNETVLSGDIGIPGNSTDNSYHVVLYIYGAEGSVLDGFTVTGGTANGGGLDDNGGGVFCKGVTARLANCLLSANLAASEGGAVFVESGGLVLTGCRLVGNAANGWGGGAVRLYRTPFQISGCFFGGNAATGGDPMGYGGAVRAESCAPGTITDCLFVANRGRQGGAIRTSRGTSPTIERCRFGGNQAPGSGGAIANGSDCSPTLRDCILAGNESAWGGAVANWMAGGSAIGCTLVGNVASQSGGAIASRDNHSSVLNCTLVANSAGKGGGVYACRNGSTALANCVLWGNRSDSAGSQAYYDDAHGAAGGDFTSCLVQGGWNGAGVHCQGAAWAKDGGGNLDADPAFAGVMASGTWTAIETSSADTGMTALTCSDTGWQQDAFAGGFLNPDTSQYLQYCVVGNTANTITILGDCTGFTSVGDTFHVNDYRLRPASPCSDAGLGDTDTPADDLAGKARHDDPGKPNTGTGAPAHVDIGAYEFQGTTPAAVTLATVGAVAAVPPPGQDWTVPDLGMELAWVGSGEFQMGAKDGEDHEGPVHQVRISNGFWLGRYEVTQTEYQALATPGSDPGSGARLPVTNVSWYDAEAFCRKLTNRERDAGRLPDGCEYRLPTEAEWEYAARGGTQSRGQVYPGSDCLDEVAWQMNNSGGAPHPVGGKTPNELGLHDLAGNVWEWCLDWSDPGFYSRSPAADPFNADAATLRVTRGGSWVHVAEWARIGHRGGWRPERANDNIGFRVCLAPTIATPAL